MGKSRAELDALEKEFDEAMTKAIGELIEELNEEIEASGGMESLYRDMIDAFTKK